MKTHAAALAVAAFVAWALKHHYATAAAEDLGWILAPTAEFVGLVSGVSFTPLTGEGYFSRERLFLIEKSCAGINFMIAAFVMLVWDGLHRLSSVVSATRLLGVSLLISYAAAVGANTVRIIIAMWVAAHPPGLTFGSPADLHRIAGIVVYFVALVLLYDLAQRHRHRVEAAR